MAISSHQVSVKVSGFQTEPIVLNIAAESAEQAEKYVLEKLKALDHTSAGVILKRIIVEMEEEFKDSPTEGFDYDHVNDNVTEAYKCAQAAHPNARIIGHHLQWWKDN